MTAPINKADNSGLALLPLLPVMLVLYSWHLIVVSGWPEPPPPTSCSYIWVPEQPNMKFTLDSISKCYLIDRQQAVLGYVFLLLLDVLAVTCGITRHHYLYDIIAGIFLLFSWNVETTDGMQIQTEEGWTRNHDTGRKCECSVDILVPVKMFNLVQCQEHNFPFDIELISIVIVSPIS